MLTLGHIMDKNSLYYSSKAATIYKNNRITYSEINGRINQLANAFRKIGINRGDRVAILLFNSDVWPQIIFALAKIGAVAVPLNFRLRGKEIIFLVNNSEPVAFITEKVFLDLISGISSDLPSVRHYIATDFQEKGVLNLDRLMASESSSFNPVDLDENDLMFINYTSGTTGLPKGAMITHRNVLANATNRGIAYHFSHDDRVLIGTPIFHAAAGMGLMCCFLFGATAIILREFVPSQYLETIEKEKITLGGGVPAQIIFCLEDPALGKYDYSSLRYVTYGAAPMPADRIKAAMEVFKCKFQQGFGQTESTSFLTSLSPEDHAVKDQDLLNKRLTSCGRAGINIEVRVADNNDRPVENGQIGEIIARGANIMKGYWRNPEATAETLRNGWLHTGDLATMDEEGYIYICDRKKDMIISGGENIYPIEIENIISSHPGVLEVAVIGVPDAKWGEAVKAIVVPRAGFSLTEQEIIQFCAENIASYKKPKSVDFVEALPRNATGKVLKYELREKYWQDHSRRVH